MKMKSILYDNNAIKEINLNDNNAYQSMKGNMNANLIYGNKHDSNLYEEP